MLLKYVPVLCRGITANMPKMEFISRPIKLCLPHPYCFIIVTNSTTCLEEYLARKMAVMSFTHVEGNKRIYTLIPGKLLIKKVTRQHHTHFLTGQKDELK